MDLVTKETWTTTTKKHIYDVSISDAVIIYDDVPIQLN